MKKVIMIGGRLTALGIAVCLAGVAVASELDDLLPVPVSVERRVVRVPSSVLDRTSVRRGAIQCAPADVAGEAYALDITNDGVAIVAASDAGERWARVTIAQLKALSTDGRVESCMITDWPKFRWRGFMHDSARNFLEIKDVKSVIDAMSAAKMNLFHWHLTEYYGWRLESKRFPELQKKESFYIRDIGRYYTQKQFREIVDYASERGVTVMPEFDIPGHALAFRRAFGFKTMRDEGVREKLCELVDELCGLAPAEKMPFVHLGSDEARLPEEKVPPQWMEPIVARVHAAGRTVVGWVPGELAGLEGNGPLVGMRWGNVKDAQSLKGVPCLDASDMYLDTLDPFEMLGMAAYRRICPWNEGTSARLGAITCAWHDDYAGGGERTLRNQAVFPALVMFGDSFWRGRDDSDMRDSGRMLPRAGNPLLAKAADLERRVAVHRDRIWAKTPHPFQFLRQTDVRWRISTPDGKCIADDVAQSTLFFWQNANAGVEDGEGGESRGNLFAERQGTAIAETWIKSPVDQDVGAWIGFTDFTRDHGRAFAAPTPPEGMWNRFGAEAEINGERIDPPKWRKPGQRAGADVTHLLHVHELDEIPFEDEEYYMRPPTRVRLKKGWNHVKLTAPMKKPARAYEPWVATFALLNGTTEHPSEVPGLEYSAKPPQEERKVLGYHLDISNCKVPTLETMKRIVEILQRLGYNHLQMNTEHTFAYSKHRAVWHASSPMTPEDVRILDAYCAERGIELVPNQNSFGHLGKWLRLPEYNHLAESPHGGCHSRYRKTPMKYPTSLCPTDPRSIEFIAGLYDELLPCFRSRLVNVGLDETYELDDVTGTGRSAAEIKAKGAERVYLEHFKKIYALVKARGHQMMFWGDIILHKPELIPEIPEDVICLNWGYWPGHPFDREAAKFAAAKRRFLICPGTRTWGTLSGCVPDMCTNVDDAIRAGEKHGAAGYLMADWDDGGGISPWIVSLPPVVYLSLRTRGIKPTHEQFVAEIDRVSGCRCGESLLEYGKIYLASKGRNDNATEHGYALREGKHYKRGKGVTDATLAAAKERHQKAKRLFDAESAPQWIRDDFELLDLICTASEVRADKPETANFRAMFEPDYRRLWLKNSRPGGLEESLNINFGL